MLLFVRAFVLLESWQLYFSKSTFQRLLNADVVLIDEYSMITSTLMNAVVYRLPQVCQSHRVDPFLQKCIIVMGDQLPPVCRHSVSENEVCRRCHISNAVVWRNLLVWKHFLLHSFRHVDDYVFLSFLHVIREARPTWEEVKSVLGRCEQSKAASFGPQQCRHQGNMHS